MGGGIIGTAAKAAVSGAFRTPFIVEAGRRIARKQVSSFTPAVESGNLVPALSTGHERGEVAAVAVATHWPEYEFDGWELAGGKEENFESVNSAPRLIFGPVPTLEEAEEATADLKDALEKVYFTPQRTLESNHEVCEEIDSGECSTVSSVPNHTVQMYSLLQTREAQEVVSSLASDKNVWDAVMNNAKVAQYLKSSSTDFANIHEQPAEYVAENESTDEFSPDAKGKETSGNSFLKSVKNKISQMVSSISDFFKDFFGSPTGDSSNGNNTKTYFFAAAVAVIVVILLKR